MNAQDMPTDAGESKTRKKKSSRSEDDWHRHYSQDWHDGTRELNLEERGAFKDIVDLIYIFGAPLACSDQVIAGKLVIDIRKWRHLRKRLLDTGKLFLTDEGHLHNERARDELRRREEERNRRSTSARPRSDRRSTSARPRPDLAPTSAEPTPGSEKSSNENNEPSEQMLTDARAVLRDSEREIKKTPPKPPRGAEGKAYWQSVLNPTSLGDVLYVDGRLTLVNGTRVRWLLEFGGDDRTLDLALGEIRIQSNSSESIASQVERHLSRICRMSHQSKQNRRSSSPKLEAALAFEAEAFGNGNRRSAR